ncbi:erythromycin esterase family protein [Asticcacaulis solisilvae]|uniref:erythromycin esterase family protein n=1 Tax=Asticcacaulis solisilvae TaxID=1217274 RepID=UPI003FD74F1E
MRLHDRRQAGRDLARQLSEFAGTRDCIVLALPRGGVPVGFEIARALGLPLDVFLVRKLGLPSNPEIAMGAVASGGLRVMNDDVVKACNIDEAAIEQVAEAEAIELKRRERIYRDGKAYPKVRDKTVIVVDDGVATGASLRAALKALRREGPKRLIAAIPVAPPCEDNDLPEADEVFCLMRPHPFYSVGLNYERFDQVPDAEVVRLLKEAGAFAPEPARGHADIIAGRLRPFATPLTGARGDYDALMVMAENARFVLIGEASHGTAEFYRRRAEITRRLIEEKGFMAVAVEADWPDAFTVNRYLKSDKVASAAEALSDFRRFPTWVWRNTEVRGFVDWLHDYNIRSRRGAVGFYGLDLYSLNSSIDAVVAYLESVDPEAAKRARSRYGCMTAYADPEAYGYMTGRAGDASCEDELAAQLRDLRQNTFAWLDHDGALDGEAFFSAEQNARLVKNAEVYYRAMFRGRPRSWNVRDTHMADTLDELADFLGEQQGRPARIVVWAHNSHIGDARATDMRRRGELNLGQLVRQRHPDESLLIGFSTYNGTVTAAEDWDRPHETKQVRDALAGSIEDILHRVGMPEFLLNLRDRPEVRHLLEEPRISRFIGVIYRPDTERQTHYYDVALPDEFDAVIHLDQTSALQPLPETRAWEPELHAGETYPTGL